MWLGADENTDPAADNEWPLLPFMSLTDGAHSYVLRPCFRWGEGIADDEGK